jgi:hypothetical protein
MNINKTCCCCGGRAYGKQWWNRDRGYSLCGLCGDWLAKKETPEEMQSNYGKRGVHWDAKLK